MSIYSLMIACNIIGAVVSFVYLHLSAHHFSLQSYCIDRTASNALLMSSPQKDSLPKSQILGIPFSVLPFTCLIGLCMQSVNARKIKFPTSEADKASIKGKKIKFNSNGYESKKTDKRTRQAV